MKSVKKHIRKHLEELRKIKRSKHHPLIHKIHEKHGISKKTLFYVKEYGTHSNAARTIIRESIKILLMASILSSIGGFGLEYIKTIFIPIVPLIILLPVLNDMIGDYGTIVSSKFSAMLHEGKIRGSPWGNSELKKLFVQIFIISMLTAVFSSVVALIISNFSNYALSIIIACKIILVAIADVILLVSILFLVSVFAGLYFYKKEEDPNNFLIPITTSVADFGNMVILVVLVILFFA
jgi:cation transporter-like permease